MSIKKIKYKEMSQSMKNIINPIRDEKNSRVAIGIDKNTGEYHYLNVKDLEPYIGQARVKFDEETLSELADSIKENGIRQPLTVKLNPETKKYSIISGERRFRASQLVGLQIVPCIILKPIESSEVIALIENLHRRDLHPLELLKGYNNLLDLGICKTAVDISKRIGVSRDKVAEILTYRNIAEDKRDILIENDISDRKSLRKLRKLSREKQEEEISKLINKPVIERQNKTLLKIVKNPEGLFLEKAELKLTESEKYQLSKIIDELQKIIE